MTDRPDALSPPTDAGWQVVVDGWDPGREAAVESILAVVNGYCGVRAAVEEGSAASSPGTYVNGVFDAAHEASAQAAATPEHSVTAAPTSELVRAPDWSRVRVLVDGVPLDLGHAELLEQRRVLDLSRGALLRTWRLRHGERATRLRSLRFASLDDRHVLGQVLEVTPEDWGGQLVIEMAVDADVTNDGGIRHLVATATERRGGCPVLVARTSESDITIAMAARAATHGAAGALAPELAERSVVHRAVLTAEPGRAEVVEKLVAVVTSRDGPDPAAAAAARLEGAASLGLTEVRRRSAAAWGDRWRDADIVVSDEPALQQQARFAIYHLVGCANPDDEWASPGARSLTGERYRGHVFWDTEIFVLPFFCLTHPPTARALLMYRFHTLPAARDRARAQGHTGALYAWESTDTGVDLTPPYVINAAGDRLEILTGEQEHHISADIGHAVCRYWDATGDDGFMLEAGAAMLVEVARFWASRASVGADARQHILRVIGPDEYHESVDDNAYTNRLARDVLRRAAATAAWMAGSHRDRWAVLVSELAIGDGEPDAWRRVADALVDGLEPATGLVEQHDGYFELAPADLGRFEPRSQTMDNLMAWDELVATQILKQADVLMLPAVLPEELSELALAANYDYYEPRTSHDSSLSAPVHALVAARLNRLDDARRYLDRAAGIDLDLERGVTAAGGVHIAALGGMWQALVLGFAGVRASGDLLEAVPHVPAEWGELAIALQWDGRRLRCRAAGEAGAMEARG